MTLWNRISRLAIFVAVFGCLSTFVHAGSSANMRDLDTYFAEALKQWRVPGMAIAILHDGKVVLMKGYGKRHISEGGEVDEHTLFAIASNTKAFTAATLAILVDEKKVGWEDRVIEYLPYFQLHDAYATREMRIRDLLCHRSGLGTFSGDLLWYGTNYSAEEVIKRVRYLPLTSSFRSQYGYSNLMFIAAGEVVRHISGVSWQEFVRERILDKLDMKRTVISVSALAERDNVAMPHRVVDDEVVALEWYDWDNMAAAGGIISSVSDMSKWLELQLNHGSIGDEQIFSLDQLHEMWSAYTPLAFSEKAKERFPATNFRAYGLGWSMMDYHGHKVLQHGGGYDGMFSRVAIVPEKDLAMVILTNGMTSLQTALCYRILDTYLAREVRDWSAEFMIWDEEQKKEKAQKQAKMAEQRVTKTTPSLPLSNYTGRYGGPMYGDATITLEDDALVLRLLPNPDLVGDLSHWHFDTFVVTWRKQFAWFNDGKVQFELDQNANVDEMKIDVPNEDFWFTELEFKRK